MDATHDRARRGCDVSRPADLRRRLDQIADAPEISVEEARRQSCAVAASDRADDDVMGFLDAALADVEGNDA